MPLAIGTLLKDRYRIVSILGQGGMGAVYRAYDEHLEIPVAVKENLFLTEEYGRQFQREARILAGLRQANLPHVSDYFALENQGQYLVMDYIEGEDLRQRMERMGALPEREAILIGISICDALTYLHNRRLPIVHRDIKPGNIKVTPDGQAVLVDFGLAKVMEGSQVTSTGARAMTPGYSPPEQYGTARTDPRSDIYSLGATLYAVLTGSIPEDGLGRMTGKSKLTPIRELAPKVNRRLAEAIEHALEIDPDDRYQTAEEFKAALIESGELADYYPERPTISPPPQVPANEPGAPEEAGPGSAPRPQEWSSSRRRKRRNPWVAVPIAVVLIAGLFFLLMLQPDFSRSVLGFFNPENTSASRATRIAAIGVGQPSVPALQATATPTIPATPVSATSIPPAVALFPTETVVPTVTPSPTATPIGGGIGQIAYASDRFGTMQIFLLDLATKKEKPLTPSKISACQPTWSADGKRMAFTSPCPAKQDSYPGSNIYIINIDPAGNPDLNSLVQITSGLEGDYDPDWSPDGKRIAFTSLRNQRSTIWLLNLEDMSLLQLTSGAYMDKQPAWSPSGMQIAFVRMAPFNQIWWMNDNGNPQTLFSIKGPTNNTGPTWSADGSVIFYSQSSIDSNIPLLVYRRFEDRNTAAETRIPANPNRDIGPIAGVHKSPDGYWLAFESWTQTSNKVVNHDIYIMNVNGSNLERLTTDPGFDFSPAWRPLAKITP